MSDLSMEVSAPGVIHLFGEYAKMIGEPTVAMAIDLRVTIKTKKPEFNFFVIDGYKLDPKKHSIFNKAVKRFWRGPPLEFSTLSQFPMLTGLGTPTAVSVALAGVLMNLNNRAETKSSSEKAPVNKKELSIQANAIEHSVNPFTTPLGTATSILGGIVLLNDTKTDALWALKKQQKKWYIHQIKALLDTPLVIGFVKEAAIAKFDIKEPRPLFDTAIKKPTKKHIQLGKSGKTKQQNAQSTPSKINRMLSQRGFAKDVLKDMGKIARKSVEILPKNDLAKLGALMNEQLNLIKMLGVYTENLRGMVEAAKKHSYGVSLTGANGDVVLALTKEPESVVKDIESYGGQAIITSVSQDGIT